MLVVQHPPGCLPPAVTSRLGQALTARVIDAAKRRLVECRCPKRSLGVKSGLRGPWPGSRLSTGVVLALPIDVDEPETCRSIRRWEGIVSSRTRKFRSGLRPDSRRRARKVGVSAAIVAALTVLGSLPASADSSATSTDGGAYGSFTSYGEKFFLDDIKCDSHSVYINYSLAGGSTQRFENTQGCNTPGLTLNLSVAEGTRVEWRVCTNIQLAPDNCSPWITDRA